MGGSSSKIPVKAQPILGEGLGEKMEQTLAGYKHTPGTAECNQDPKTALTLTSR
jgi:hypothetical protein